MAPDDGKFIPSFVKISNCVQKLWQQRDMEKCAYARTHAQEYSIKTYIK